MAEIISIGAYKKGTDPEVDAAIEFYNVLEEFFSQAPDEVSHMTESYKKLADLLKISIDSPHPSPRT